MDTSLLIDLNRKRSLERRRETSKHAARDRRGKEADIFLDLKDEVPVVDETTVTHVDRIALLRVASTMCRLRKRASSFLKFDASSELEPTEVWSENTLSECLDGFMLIADSDGTILYVTESVSIFLGLTQTDLVGRFLSEFVHRDDYDELTRSSMGDSSDDEAATGKIGHGTIVRIKTVISPRGRNLNLKSALYKATICRFRVVSTEFGQIWVLHASSSPAGQSSAIVMSNSPMRGSEATTRVFMTRHTSEMRFTYVSESLNLMLRHESRSLTGTSFYDLVYPADLPHVVTCMRELQQKGHCRTSFYRLIGANSSVTWVQTEATTVSHTTKGTKGHYVLCLHSILGTQSEMDSWTASLANSVSAARPVRRSVKAEIEDVSEYYFGLQPMVVECVDFEPLIEPTPQGYRPHDGPRRVSVARQSAEDLRADESGYEEVLQWLFRDGPDSPPPYAPALYRSDNSEAASQGGRVQPMVYVGSRRQSDAASLSGNTYQRVGGTFRSPGPYGSPQSFRFSSAERAQYGSPAGMRSTEPSPRRYATLEDRVVGYGVRPAGAAPLDRDGRPLRGAVSLERRDAAALQRAQQFGGADLRQSQMAALQQRYRSESGGRAAGTASPLAEGLAQRRFVAGSPQGVPLAAAVHGAGRASRFDTHFQQRPLSRSVAAAAETVERSRSAHSNGRVVSAVQPSNAYVMSNLERGRAQPGRRTPSATLQPVVFVTSPQALGRGYAARSISREGAYGRRTPSQTQRAEVYLPEQRYRGHEQSANCQPRQQQSVAALNVNQLPAAGMPATLPLRGMDIRQSVVPSPPDQGYSPPQKRQHLGYLPNDPYCTFDDEYCNMYQEGGEQYGAQLAPFIPQEDLFQLSDSLPTDLQNLFPEIEFSEFFAADVPPSKTQMMNPPVPMQSESMFPSEVFSIDDAGSFYDALAQQAAS